MTTTVQTIEDKLAQLRAEYKGASPERQGKIMNEVAYLKNHTCYECKRYEWDYEGHWPYCSEACHDAASAAARQTPDPRKRTVADLQARALEIANEIRQKKQNHPEG